MWRACFESGVGVTDPHPLAEQEQYFLLDIVPSNTVRVAMSGTQLIGFIAASAESVTQLHVRTGFQRRGVGTALLSWAKRQSRGSLWLYTFARNRVARAFYEHHGFVAVAHGFEPVWRLEDVKYHWSAHPRNAT